MVTPGGLEGERKEIVSTGVYQCFRHKVSHRTGRTDSNGRLRKRQLTRLTQSSPVVCHSLSVISPCPVTRSTHLASLSVTRRLAVTTRGRSKLVPRVMSIFFFFFFCRVRDSIAF